MRPLASTARHSATPSASVLHAAVSLITCFFRLKRLDGERGVLVAVIRQDDRVHIMFEKTVVVGVGCHPVFPTYLFELLLPCVAKRHELHAHDAAVAPRAKL